MGNELLFFWADAAPEKRDAPPEVTCCDGGRCSYIGTTWFVPDDGGRVFRLTSYGSYAGRHGGGQERDLVNFGRIQGMEALLAEMDDCMAEKIAHFSPTLSNAIFNGIRQEKPLPGKASFERCPDPSQEGGHVWCLTTALNGWSTPIDSHSFLCQHALTIMDELTSPGNGSEPAHDTGCHCILPVLASILANAEAVNSAIRAKISLNPALRIMVGLAKSGLFARQNAGAWNGPG